MSATEHDDVHHDARPHYHVDIHIGPNTHFVDDGSVYLVHECRDNNCAGDDAVYVLTRADYRSIVNNQCPRPAIHYPAHHVVDIGYVSNEHLRAIALDDGDDLHRPRDGGADD